MLKIPDILFIFAVCAIINGIVFLFFFLDKRAARKGTRRTPENTLLLYAIYRAFWSLCSDEGVPPQDP